MILLDTVVLSEFRKKNMDPNVRRWFLDHRDEDFVISVISIGEISKGIAKQRKTDPVFAERLQTWQNELIRKFGARILRFGIEEARLWGALVAELKHDGADLRNGQIIT